MPSYSDSKTSSSPEQNTQNNAGQTGEALQKASGAQVVKDRAKAQKGKGNKMAESGNVNDLKVDGVGNIVTNSQTDLGAIEAALDFAGQNSKILADTSAASSLLAKTTLDSNASLAESAATGGAAAQNKTVLIVAGILAALAALWIFKRR